MRKSLIHRHLDPSETLLEILFGLIMALTLTVGARLLIHSEPVETLTLIAGIVGCNVAWGVIDGAFYLLGAVFNRNRRVMFAKRIQAARTEAEAMDAVRDEFGLEGEPPMREEDKASFYRILLTMMQHADTGRARFRRDDFAAAAVIIVLVSLTALPAAIALLVIKDSALALRIANFVQIGLFFAIGWTWAGYSGASRWRAGIVIGIIGTALVALAVALGG